jgi:serine/threonine protein kinase
MNGTTSIMSTANSPKSHNGARKVVMITAVEDEDEEEHGDTFQETNDNVDVIPGPPPGIMSSEKEYSGSGHNNSTSTNGSGKRSLIARVLGNSRRKGRTGSTDELQISNTEHRMAGTGILASRTDLALSPEEFSAGCSLLQRAALADLAGMKDLLKARPEHVNFRDYDRRTALHVAASEGHLDICKFLIDRGARINRSDRWGGSPLDDAHRHRHLDVIPYLREKGASTGSGNRLTNLIKAAADGDIDEVEMLVQNAASVGKDKLDINKGDYDKRTALHLAAGEGHDGIVKFLCDAGAEVNVEDRWFRRPLDDAYQGSHEKCVTILESFGAAEGKEGRKKVTTNIFDQSSERQAENLKIDFGELEMIDKIGSGAFGEIYKCRWRGTLTAAKIVKSAKIRREWLNKRISEAVKSGKDVDDAIKELDEADMEETDKDLALADFRQEISVLKSLRHPHIVLMLAYSTTTNYEVMISELMKCSLLDVFKAHHLQGTRMAKRTKILYATQLAQGMNYLHTCKPPIIHRDLKPANLLIDHAGTLKISDFGLSKIRPDPAKKETETFIMTGETGSYRFMAPEVFRHEDYNETVDIYSYAMILFYLMVGRPPWATLAGMVAVKKAAEEGDRPNIPRDLDVRLQNLMKDCWDDDANLRPSFTKILEILSQYSKEVLHQDSNNIPSTATPDFECACAIL